MCKTRLNATQQKTTISSFFFKTQMLFPRIQIQENTPSSSKARQNNRDENWKDTNILLKKIPPAARSQRTSRCSRRLQLNMTAISGWQFSGKLLKTLPKRLYIYIYIYIGCTTANYTFLNASFHYYFKGPRVLKQHRQRLVTQKVKSRYFKLYSVNSISFNSSNVGNIFWN